MSGAVAQVPFGFLNIRKPPGMTAHDVVGAVRRIVRIKQVGHGGTLDPMAEGVLPVAVGKACRLLRFMEGRKVYLAEIRLGESRTTDDIEGEILTQCSAEQLPEEAAVRLALPRFQGTIKQTPPLYSAVHVGGKRLYQMARAGEAVEHIPERTVVIHQLDALNYTKPVLTVRVDCAAGTYIRSIARDLGEVLGCCGCLQSLIREQAGPFRLEQSVTLDQLKEAAQAEPGNSWAAKFLVPPHMVLPLPKVDLNGDQAAKLRMGQSIVIEPHSDMQDSDSTVVMTVLDGAIVAICRQINVSVDVSVDGSSDATGESSPGQNSKTIVDSAGFATTHGLKRLSPEVVLST